VDNQRPAGEPFYLPRPCAIPRYATDRPARSVGNTGEFDQRTLHHVFDLEGHPNAKRAYAWSSPIEGSDKRRFFAVLQMGAILSPADAVRAAIVAEAMAIKCVGWTR
jgi:hypothetical protein